MWYGYRKHQHGSGKISSVYGHPSRTKNFRKRLPFSFSALPRQAHEVISVVSLIKLAEAQVVARAKAQQNYCQKIKSPRKSRSLAWKNNEVLEVLELLDIMQFIIVLIMRTP